MKKFKYIKFFDYISLKDLKDVGGKNASLGEMIKNLKKYKIAVPNGFATLSKAYLYFLKENKLKKIIFSLLKQINKDKKNLSEIGQKIRKLIISAKIPKDLEKEILEAYRILSKKYNHKFIDVAVRSSATAEDLPNASFAGQLESFLNISGEKQLLDSFKKCTASLFTNRAIAYRIEKKFSHEKVSLSVGVQKMIRSDKASSGVMFSIDTESGFDKVVSISAGYGLGENIVQGNIIPDEYEVYAPLLKDKKNIPIIKKNLGTKLKKLIYSKGKNNTIKNIDVSKKMQNKFVLTDKEIITLAKIAKQIEKHYKKPMDIEWAKDGVSQKIYIVQARPETVKSQEKKSTFIKFKLLEKAKTLLEGIAIGEKISAGKVQVIKNVKDIKNFKDGSILVTTITTPDWVPIMKKAKGIITDKGGKTSHAAIVSRELNIPAIVGTKKATKILKDNNEITMSCSEGEIGKIYPKLLKYQIIEKDLSKLKKIKTKIMINLASPDSAFNWWRLPISGIGLLRIEFIIANQIKIHPLALINFNKIKDNKIKKKILEQTKNYKDKSEFFIDILSRGISKIASLAYPDDAIVRLSDFKTNEYKDLIGGDLFEEKEENPMLGFRGASRYYSKEYLKAFELECKAIKRAREKYGFKNIIIMVPFCRTITEAKKVISLLSKNGLKKSKNLKIYVMAEIPSNILLAKEFAEIFDGFSIGSNDLTQLILGVDRDSEKLSSIFKANDPSIKKAIKELIKIAHSNNKKVGICGQAPSDDKNFAKFLMTNKIDSISLNPDSVFDTINLLSKIP